MGKWQGMLYIIKKIWLWHQILINVVIIRYYLYSSPEMLCKKGAEMKSRYHWYKGKHMNNLIISKLYL